jgi:hypothetical protein
LLNGTEWLRPITGQYPSWKWVDTNCRGGLVRPLSSHLLLIDCCYFMNDWMEWIIKSVTNEVNWGFHIHNSWHIFYLSTCVTLLYLILENLNLYLFTFSFDEAVLHYYSGIKIILYQFARHSHKRPDLVGLETRNILFLASF